MRKSKSAALGLCRLLGTNTSCISRIFVIAFFVLSIGAKDCGNLGGNVAPPPASRKPFGTIDPPLGCAAFCEDVDVVSFTPQCENVEASDREIAFEITVMNNVKQAEAQGKQVCPQADLTAFVTPCAIGIPPVEHPNQDHEVCANPPLNCPL